MSRHHSGRKRRQFSMLNKRYVSKNYLKKWVMVVRDIKENHDVQQTELELMLHIYDYEFFTVSWLASKLKRSRNKLYERTLLPLKQRGWVEVAYSNHDVDEYVKALFKEDGQAHENRLALSQKGRLLVQRVYRKLEGGEPVNL